MDEKDKKALEAIRIRAEDRKASPEIGGVREWFEIDRLLEIMEKIQTAPVYVVMAYWDYEGGDCLGAYSDKEKAISLAGESETGDRVEVQVWAGDESVGVAYYKQVD